METKEVELTEREKFSAFLGIMEKNGFRLITQREKGEYQKALGLVSPEGRRRRGGQLAMTYIHITRMQVFVWTTLDPNTGELIPKGDAMAWVLIINEVGIVDYFNPIKRVGPYWNNLKNSAIACKERVENRPRCKECGDYMNIARRHGVLKARFWRCKKHPKERTGWDHGVSPKKLAVVQANRKSRANYRLARKKAGQSTHQAMLKRRTWKQKKS